MVRGRLIGFVLCLQRIIKPHIKTRSTVYIMGSEESLCGDPVILRDSFFILSKKQTNISRECKV